MAVCVREIRPNAEDQQERRLRPLAPRLLRALPGRNEHGQVIGATDRLGGKPPSDRYISWRCCHVVPSRGHRCGWATPPDLSGRPQFITDGQPDSRVDSTPPGQAENRRLTLARSARTLPSFFVMRVYFSRRLAAGAAMGAFGSLAKAEVSFEKQVKPVLESACLSCHGEKKPKGSFNCTPTKGCWKVGVRQGCGARN